MTTEIKVPVLPESVADATVATWHVQVGEKFTRDQVLVDIETDKVVLEVPATCDGVMTDISQSDGATVLGDQVIGTYAEGSVAVAAPAAAPVAVAATSAVNVIDIVVPVLPESVADATVATWHVATGDTVSVDQNLVDIETDKVVLEVVAQENGVIGKIIHVEGDTVLGAQKIGELNAGATANTTATATSEEAVSSDELASPSVRRLMTEKGLTASDVVGTGKGGRISKEDVAAAANSPKGKPAAAPVAKAAVPAVEDLGERTQKRVPMTRLRKTIATRLLAAKNETAMLTTFNEVNMKPIMDLRKKYKDLFEKTHDTRLGFMSFYVKAVTEALKRYPAINASIDGDDIVYHNFFDISIAVSTPRGLVTPVLRDTDQLSMAGIENGIRALALKGRDGKLSLAEMTGGTFTITNGGVFGSLLSTPILNLPQAAILGMHKIQDRPMAVDGNVVILPMMYLALSYDHRLVDGKESVGFLVTIKDLLEDPTRLLLDI
ncbi:2-oxoglutarate dehydrogenase [Colwellia sp. MT41]|uniref:2-oxoglutarate dehydrogenase complex dihydrolipoyllysine-residue succinyltransferase n=1 Tax=Colwellia sp. MT41 TaxID=58049 RepID=UPI0007179C40|nr:2-oxoglutarate dehydrogenase complex dihydrolipoyllysine-residue succinyltransferase [Colwellia sp. MT41]ALO35022.1 2-oxoglutarate dehydrogenase [Colwellia sp. MT41]